MVVLQIRSINSKGHPQEFSAGKIELEEAFELLNQLVVQGVTLLSVTYYDEEHKRVSLPVTAFDGAPMKESVGRLQLEWEAALLKTV